MPDSSSYYGNIRAEVAIFLPDRYSKVLEVGCGEGNFRANLGQRCEYWGIEPFPVAAEVAVKYLDRVIEGVYDEAFDRLPERYFDLVICNDVIEHMIDHDSFFRTIKLKMTDGGFIVGSIPNVRYFDNLVELLMRKDWRYRDQGILDKTHLRFFTEKSLKRVFIEHQFTIEEFAGINRMKTRVASVKGMVKELLIRVLGGDAQFRQFGFRIRYR